MIQPSAIFMFQAIAVVARDIGQRGLGQRCIRNPCRGLALNDHFIADDSRVKIATRLLGATRDQVSVDVDDIATTVGLGREPATRECAESLDDLRVAGIVCRIRRE
ncbi:hypothetical protein D3C81_1667380 [compost metagenome]